MTDTIITALRQKFNNIEWHSFWDETEANEALNEIASGQENNKKRTNREWLNSLSDEELFCFLTTGLLVVNSKRPHNPFKVSVSNLTDVREWLQKESSYEVPKATGEYRVCAECSACVRGYFKSSPDAYVCVGARHPFVVEFIDEPCLLKRR